MILSDRDVKNLVRKISKQVDKDQAKKKERPKYDNAIVESGKAENQDDLDAQFAHMKRREF